MALLRSVTPYVPGTYAKRRPEAGEMVSRFVHEWESRRRKLAQQKGASLQIPPCICFSRKIGVGALEIADLLGRKLRLHVADREILERMTGETGLDKETVQFFDEIYPGKTVELSAMIFGEKSFVMGDYMRSLVGAVLALAATESTIFVGRGTHLILPRDRVLAVRLICSDEFRIRRLAALLKVSEAEASATLAKIDREQRAFFKKAFGKKDASPYEFDMVINCDHINSPSLAADLVSRAFRKKFAADLTHG
ncbi:MAG: cytidylate kinase-like family protein [Desulfobacteraceae bacterium]|nr:MAG: cytidylate kinase-like family protein [Desulfobacteraceae bacterium]